MRDLAILNYHGIQSKPSEYSWSKEEKVYVTGFDDFRRHLEYARDAGYQTLLPRDLPDWKSGKLPVEKPLMITFDDGHISHYEHAAPLLEDMGMQAVFFVSAGWLTKPEYMQDSHLKDLAARDFEVASHGSSHIPLPTLSDRELDYEIRESKVILEKACGQKIQSFSIPRGFFHKKIKEKVQASGYEFMFTSHFGLNDRNADLFYLKRLAPTARTDRRQLANWISGNLGSELFFESLKEYGRQLLGPSFYGALASIKASVLQKRSEA